MEFEFPGFTKQRCGSDDGWLTKEAMSLHSLWLLLKRSWNKAANSETQKLSRMSSFNSVDLQKHSALLPLAHPPLHCLSTQFQACSQGFKPESQEKGSSLQSPHTATRGQPLHLLQPRTFMFKKNVLIAMCFSRLMQLCFFFF